MSYLRELEVAQKAALEAAKVIKSFSSKKALDVKLKGKNDLVTKADIASEKKILEIIQFEFPGDQILAEESSNYSSLPDGRIWIIDPIDGTTNFAHGFPVYCVSIALWENGNPKVGLVYEVANDEEFYAVTNDGAYLNGDRIRISETLDPQSSLIGTGFPYTDLQLVDNYLSMFKAMMNKTHGVRRPGSAAWDLCNVACGRFEGFYEYGLSPWDVAAGSLIVKEAGGLVHDWIGGHDWLFGRRIIAGNEAICHFLKSEVALHFNREDLVI